jgi:hypothetical protein
LTGSAAGGVQHDDGQLGKGGQYGRHVNLAAVKHRINLCGQLSNGNADAPDLLQVIVNV